MFSDRQITHEFQSGPDKLNYLTDWGLAPYFKDKLKKDINDWQFLFFSFDESLNQKTYKCHIDAALRCWNEKKKKFKLITGTQFFRLCNTYRSIVAPFELH